MVFNTCSTLQCSRFIFSEKESKTCSVITSCDHNQPSKSLDQADMLVRLSQIGGEVIAKSQIHIYPESRFEIPLERIPHAACFRISANVNKLIFCKDRSGALKENNLGEFKDYRTRIEDTFFISNEALNQRPAAYTYEAYTHNGSEAQRVKDWNNSTVITHTALHRETRETIALCTINSRFFSRHARYSIYAKQDIDQRKIYYIQRGTTKEEQQRISQNSFYINAKVYNFMGNEVDVKINDTPIALEAGCYIEFGEPIDNVFIPYWRVEFLEENRN